MCVKEKIYISLPWPNADDKGFKGKPKPKKSKKKMANDENAKPLRKITMTGYGLFLKETVPD